MRVEDKELIKNLYDWLCNKFNSTYSQYMNLYELDSKTTFNLPPSTDDMCATVNKIIWINNIGNTQVLRLNVDTPIMSIQAKLLYNQDTNESQINLLNFAIHKIWLRTGGFGTKIINSIFSLQRTQLEQSFHVNPPTQMAVFGYHSILFWLKNGFNFKQMIPQEETEASHQNYTYKLFKLLIQLNTLQDVNQSIESIDLFSLETQKINDLLSKQIKAYYNRLYNQNLWIKARILDRVGNKCCEDFSANNQDFCSSVIYKNIRNQLVDDKFTETGILPILQELFYLNRAVFGTDD